MIAVAAVSGAMTVTMPAYAGSAADGSAAGSPGLVSGNVAQLPVHVPVNVCGNTVNVVGLLNPTAGNSCRNENSGGGVPGAGVSRGADRSVRVAGGATAGDGARAEGGTTDSPGVPAGNGVRLPVHLPVDLSGNSVNVVGVGNASVGNGSVNGPGDHPEAPAPAVPAESTPVSPPRHHPGPRPAPHAPSDPGPTLAHTGADDLLPTALASAGLLLGGAALYRRSRPRPTH
ncbi:chaplin [Streptomyces sp. NRRL B-3229]|uniref:chaplin n=1 Tax=Streptomyces sp. NRRL B-3229 TaxID=1463836 RepID=UPI0004C16665|nr:chaplin [Streptomyces sp. NRRL B-3229]